MTETNATSEYCCTCQQKEPAERTEENTVETGDVLKADRRAVGAAPLTERQLSESLRQLLGALNFTWNVRRLPVERVRTLSEKALRHRRCYPAEFPDFLTKQHCRRRGEVRKCR